MQQPNLPSSRLTGFHRLSLAERQTIVHDWASQTSRHWDETSRQDLFGPPNGLDLQTADQLIENTIGRFALPLGIATNFRINGRDRLIPMVTEEPSVIAGASNAARIMRLAGGITASSDPPLMIGQVQLLDVPQMKQAMAALNEKKAAILAAANEALGSLAQRGGGAREIELRQLSHAKIGPMLVVHLLVDCQDAMGANAINTALERIAPSLAEISKGRVVLRILSNLNDRRLARARAQINADAFSHSSVDGPPILQRVYEAAALAEIDPYRAATHNKGILNGIDAVVLATGNDWRAVEAGAHAYAARTGNYRSLSTWQVDEYGNLMGSLELPLALGIVGGSTRAHPGAKAALALLDVQSASELAEIVASVGLAQNFAALLALAGEGIQHGHMRLHARQIALSTGASDEMVGQIAAVMIAENDIRPSRAAELMKSMTSAGDHS